MAARILTRLNTHHHKYNIVSVTYPGIPDVESNPCGPKGRLLPQGKGFPTRYTPPSVSFKTYRALINGGQRNLTNYVLQNRKRSFITANYVWNGIMNFSKATRTRTANPSYYRCLKQLEATFKIEEQLPILSMSCVPEHIPGSTSPGLPWIITHPGWKKADVIEKYLPVIQSRWRHIGQGQTTIPLPDCAAFARSHISSPDKNKVRAVWAYPVEVICQEARFSYPLVEELKNQRIFPESAYGMEMMKGGMTWLNNQVMRTLARKPGSKFLCTDYSSFDSSVPAWLIRDCFSVIEKKFDFSRIQTSYGIVETDPEVELRKFRKMVSYFINTPIRNSDGRRFLKDHGVPSGSMFTNIIDTMVNYLVSMSLCSDVFDNPPEWGIFFGDDSLICIPPEQLLDVEAFSMSADAVFGLTIHPDKCIATRNPRNIHFLGYFNYHGTPIKSPIDLVASMLYPQTETDDWAYCISRSLGCLLASAGASTDVFQCANAVWNYAARNENATEALDRGLRLIRENPRSRRFIDQMGCGDLHFTHDFFHDMNLSVPQSNCNKLVKNVNL